MSGVTSHCTSSFLPEAMNYWHLTFLLPLYFTSVYTCFRRYDNEHYAGIDGRYGQYGYGYGENGYGNR